MVPSGLLVSVTAAITTDLAAAPFLWVAPLALFLLTYVVTFQRRPAVRHATALRLQAPPAKKKKKKKTAEAAARAETHIRGSKESVMKLLKEQGFTLERTKNHLVYTRTVVAPDGNVHPQKFTCAVTPSDPRSWMNSIRDLKKILRKGDEIVAGGGATRENA